MTAPAVSILMTVRDEADWLPAALRSLQRQTLTDWELVVVDDGSADATPRILADTATTDRRIRIVSRPAEGIVAALNAGLPLCRSELVARMDGDDICHPQRLQLQRDYLLAHPQTDLISCRVRHFPRANLSEGLQVYETWLNTLLTHDTIVRDRFVEAPLAQPSVMLRRRALIDAGGYRSADWAEDYDLWLRMAEGGARFARLPQTLLFWRDHPERVTRTSPSCSLAAFRACKAHYLKRGFLAGVSSVTLWGAGREGKLWRKELQRHGIAVDRWVEVDPRKLGQTIHGAPVVAAADVCPGSGPILITVGSRGVRDDVRRRCHDRNLTEGADFLCVT